MSTGIFFPSLMSVVSSFSLRRGFSNVGKADILQVTLTQVSWDRSWTIGGVFACSVWSENPTLVYGSVQVYGG